MIDIAGQRHAAIFTTGYEVFDDRPRAVSVTDDAEREKRWLAWRETDEGKAAIAKRRAEIAAEAEVKAPWGGDVTVLGEKRKATEEPERTS